MLEPQRKAIYVVIALAIGSVALSVAGPKMLGRATNLVFAGSMGGGNDKIVHTGQGIDFEALAETFAIVMALYVGASLLMWLQGYFLNVIVQRTIKGLRTEVDAKLMRMPLAYFDRQQHGEVLSRVTNDIDNVAMALQQTLSQILIALLTVIGVLIKMKGGRTLATLVKVDGKYCDGSGAGESARILEGHRRSADLENRPCVSRSSC